MCDYLLYDFAYYIRLQVVIPVYKVINIYDIYSVYNTSQYIKNKQLILFFRNNIFIILNVRNRKQTKYMYIIIITHKLIREK